MFSANLNEDAAQARNRPQFCAVASPDLVRAGARI